MKAAVLYGKEDVRIEQVPARALQPGEVRIDIQASLTCGTDLKVFRRGYHAKMIVPPAVFGHELAGTVAEVCPPEPPQSAVRGLGPTGPASLPARGAVELPRVGERVVVANSAPCGACLHCRNGQENLCDDLLFLNGAYAESIAVPARIAQKNLLRLKPATRFEDAALAEPLACVVLGIADTGLRAGQHVLVLGAGPIGLMFVVLARNLGCSVTVIGRGEKRLGKARSAGAQEVLDAARSPDISRTSAGKGVFDAVIEAVGKPETWEAAVRLVRKGGTVNFFGGCPSGSLVRLDTGLIHYSSLKLVASFHHTPGTIRAALELIESGVVRAADFVDGECSLNDLPALFQRMAAGNHAIKTLIRVRD